MRASQVFDEMKKQLVREALEGGNISFVARKHGISPDTLRNWVKLYRDEVEKEMGKKLSTSPTKLQNEQDWKNKHDQLVKLLGEKELEIAILKDLLKKTNPTLKLD